LLSPLGRVGGVSAVGAGTGAGVNGNSNNRNPPLRGGSTANVELMNDADQ
jgi:hypothetical protein